MQTICSPLSQCIILIRCLLLCLSIITFTVSTTISKQEKIGVRVLLNAEPFGFGPAAAIAQIFPYLRPHIQRLSFIGKGHTIDLNRSLPYDAVYDYGLLAHESKTQFVRDVLRNYDIFITACDFEAAEIARQANLKVIIYDPLTWYWPEVPALAKTADLYLAQNFFGVQERIADTAFNNAVIVPPIVTKKHNARNAARTNSLLVNLGGLSNPLIGDDLLVQYAQSIIDTIECSIAQQFDMITITTSKAIAHKLSSRHPIKTLQPCEIQQLLAQSRWAIMISGLGNIYEAAAHAQHVLWLPPTNKSQDQQLVLLKQHQLAPWAIDWEMLFSASQAHYYNTQEVTVRNTMRMKELIENKNVQQKFCNYLKDALKQTDLPVAPITLCSLFGSGGDEIIADTILTWIRKYCIQQ